MVLPALLAAGGCLLAADGPGWTAGAPFLDTIWSAPLRLDPEMGGDLVLDPPFLRDGARYDLLVVGPEPGALHLTSGGPGGVLPDEAGLPHRLAVPEEAGIHIEVMDGVRPGPGSRIQVREGEPDGIVVVRWIGFLDAVGSAATFEAILEPGGMIRAQYLQVPPAMRLSQGPATWPTLELRGGGEASSSGVVEPGSGGFRAGPGTVVAFPPEAGGGAADPWDPGVLNAVGCGDDENWCDVAERHNNSCTSGARLGQTTACTVTETTEWHFNETRWCMSCPYTYYIVVECGTEMHLPFFDTEGMVITITDVFTGVQLELESINQCARQPFRYCNNCAVGNSFIAPEGTNCAAGAPLIDCEPFLQTSALIQWGAPLADTNGDTVGDSLPCGPPNNTPCPVGESGSQPAHEQQVTDVMLIGKPGLCGVFRLDITSGGFVWDLFSNCTGTDEPAFNIYARCSDALADFDPLPELVITDFNYSGVCPDIVLEVEMTNIGCVDTPVSPLTIDFDRQNQDDISVDLGPIPVSTSVVSSIPVTLRSAPMIATAIVDEMDGLFECSEDEAGGSTHCISQTGAQSMTRTLCLCANTVRAEVEEDRVVSCGREPVVVNAGPSSVVPCNGGTALFRFRRADGTVVRDWAAGSTFTVTPTLCPSLFDYYVDVACSQELEPECIDSAFFQVECAPDPDVNVIVSDNDVCAGTTVALDAGTGFSTYAWSTAESSRVIQVAPNTNTSYSVDVVNGKGCTGQGQAEVRVVPNIIPPPLGNVLRVARENRNLRFDFPELPGSFGPYELAAVQPQACPSPPSPDPTPFIFSTAAVYATGRPPLVHVDGIDTCPDLIFYKVRGTSDCDGSPGSLCDGFPAQVLPCP